MIYFRFLLVASVLLTMSVIRAQEQQSYDYLENLNEQDSITYFNYKFQVTNYVNPKPDSALYFIKKLKKLSEDLNYGIGLSDAEYLMLGSSSNPMPR